MMEGGEERDSPPIRQIESPIHPGHGIGAQEAGPVILKGAGDKTPAREKTVGFLGGGVHPLELHSISN